MTPCFPCAWYGGYIRKGANGYYPADNGTGYFKTEKEAEDRGKQLTGLG